MTKGPDSSGNDIISLAEIDVYKTCLKQFYSKILSVTEVENYHGFFSHIIVFEHYVWLSWAIKEAAYKFLKRINTGLAFVPVKFQVKELHLSESLTQTFFKTQTGNGLTENMFFKAIVEHEDEKVYAEAGLFDEIIFSVVDRDEDFHGVKHGFCKITNPSHHSQSSSARDLLINAVAEEIGQGTLSVINDIHGIPSLFYQGKQLSIPVSISHHGLYVSYSFKRDC